MSDIYMLSVDGHIGPIDIDYQVLQDVGYFEDFDDANAAAASLFWEVLEKFGVDDEDDDDIFIDDENGSYEYCGEDVRIEVDVQTIEVGS